MNYTINFSKEQLEFLFNFLANTPAAWAKVNPLIETIKAQVDQQNEELEKEEAIEVEESK